MARRIQDSPPQSRLVAPELLRGLERDHRDLFMSLRALTAIMREPDPAPAAGEPVLARMLDAQVHQLGTLVGEITTALRVERGDPGPARVVDLGRALQTAVRRSARRVLIEVADEVLVEAHPAVLAQVAASLIALALRSAEGPVTASVIAGEGEGVLLVRVPGDGASEALDRSRSRLDLLRRLVAREGGRLSVGRTPRAAVLRASFPGAIEGRHRGREAEDQEPSRSASRRP